MSLDDDLKQLLSDLADSVAQDGINTGSAFWERISGDTGRLADTKAALSRYALNNLAAIQQPAQADLHRRSAAHDLNTIINLGAATQIEARREARAYLDRVFVAILNTAERAIDILL